MAQVRPFQFTGLKRFSREQVALQESFANYLSARPFEPDFADKIGHVLERYLKVPCKFSEAQQRPIGRSELPRLFSDIGSFVIIGAAPTEHKIIVDLDAGLAATTIDRLLGGSGDVGRIQRPLTEIEEGVLSFVLLHVLSQFHNGWSTGRELALTLDRFASRLGDFQEIADGVSSYQMLGYRLAIGKRVGYLRLLVPDGLITQTFSSAVPQTGGTPEEAVRMRRLLDSLGETPVLARVEAALLDLSADDIANLEAGDIIILEHHQLTKSAAGLDGIVSVKIGDGKNGGLRGRLISQDDQLRLEVTEIVVQEEPLEGAMVQDEDGVTEAPASVEADNLDEAQGLLRDVSAPVVVELGRVRMNTAQVIRLRPGQILRLPRGANDPVDLVVNGKLFGRGELIEVDGELGVRLLQLVGDR